MLPKPKRQELILQLLRGLSEESALSIADIHERLTDQGIEIDARTARRDINDLSRDYGLLSTEDHPERFYLSSDYHFKHQVQFTEEELQVMMIALNNLKHTSDKYFEKITSNLETLIMKNLPTETVKSLKEEKKKYFFDYSLSGRPQSSEEKDFEFILEALRSNKCFTCKNISPYKKMAQQDRLRTFAPYRFVLTGGVPYLLVRDIDDKQVKRLRLNRVKSVKIIDQSVDPKFKFDWDGFTKESFGGFGGESQRSELVELICDETMANYFFEKKIHHSQRLVQLDQDRYKLSLKVPISSELLRLIASFLPHVHELITENIRIQLMQIIGRAMRRLEFAA